MQNVCYPLEMLSTITVSNTDTKLMCKRLHPEVFVLQVEVIL